MLKFIVPLFFIAYRQEKQNWKDYDDFDYVVINDLVFFL